MQNSIILQNVSREELLQDLRSMIEEVLNEKLRPESPKEYLTRNEVAEKLRSSLPTIDRMTASGVLIGYRHGRRILYRADQVESALTQIEALKYKHH